MATLDPYRVLELEASASPEAIRAAYRRLAARAHPDVNPGAREAAERQMKEINGAYAILRARHHRARTRAARAAGAAPPVMDPWMTDPLPPPDPPEEDERDPIASERFRRRYMEPGESNAPNHWVAPAELRGSGGSGGWLSPVSSWRLASIAAFLLAAAVQALVSDASAAIVIIFSAAAAVLVTLTAARALAADGAHRSPPTDPR